MIIPFIGVFISLTIWGTFLPVPGISTPNDRFVKRISSAIEVTAMAKGIHDLSEMVTVSAHTHRAPFQSAHEPEPPIDIISPDVITTPQTRALNVVVPLHRDPDPDFSEEDRQVCIPPPGFFIPGRYRSMTPCFVCGLLTVAKVLAILWFLYEIVALMVSMAWALLRDMYGLIFEIVSQVTGPRPHPRPAVVDSPAGLYEGIDALVDGSGSRSAGGACCFPFQDAVPPAQGTVVVAGRQKMIEEQRMRARSCEMETETATAMAISRPGHQRAPVLSAAQEETTLDGSEDEDEVRSVADADLDAASAWAPSYLPARHWALVVRRLENVSPFFFLQFFWVLFAMNQPWEQQPQQQQQQQQSNEDSKGAVAETSGEKRKRPSQAKRRRYARRRQREQQEGDEREVTVVSR